MVKIWTGFAGITGNWQGLFSKQC